MALVKCPECASEVSTAAAACPKCGASRIPKKKTSAFTWIVTIIAGFWLVGYLSTKQKEVETAAGGPSPKEQARKLVEFDFQWSRGGFDTILMLNAKIQNKSRSGIKDFTITCSGYGASGTRIDSNQKTFYEVVHKGETRTFKELNMGFLNSQVHEARCGLADFVLL